MSTRRASWPWVAWSVLGIAGWIGATVTAAATVDDPSDAAGRILRTFALGGAAFLFITFAAAAVGIRRQHGALDEDLYRRLAVEPLSDRAVRRATAGHRRLGAVYVLFGFVTSALALLAYGLGDDDLLAPLLYAALGVAVLWGVVAVWALRSLAGRADALLGPLGLRATSTPGWLPRPSGSGRLVGAMRVEGVRNGRAVAITQRPASAVTTVDGARAVETVSDPDALPARTGIAASSWRGVRTESGPGGVVVRRRGNGAGRWVLEDLLLAELL